MIISPTYCKTGNGSNLLEINNRFIYGKDVLHVKVPHIEGLRTPDIIEFTRQHMEIDSNLPEYKTARYPSRGGYETSVWNAVLIMGLVATAIGETFTKFVQTKMQESEDEYSVKKHTQFKALPEFVSLIKEDKILSSNITTLNTFRKQRKILSAS